ncbi:DNA adenine methylase [Asticcacaulis sp. BYS171W]|uniref:DNA adenine methylase n=1 Tax=Asticcacaulis aquaticus TaxID=2984212 RepID=A0ABT5HT34_9CAUL|nr:DNA adenine methylase [Asticcacaulis aquaticus]MDC7683236.1 DNA adenine methylase [Asticcacaulis aquaticus]
MTSAITHTALRYHGAKFRLAPWIMSFFPAHRTYVEPFGGAAGVLLRKQPAYAEVYNDLDGEVVSFFRVLRDPAQRAELEHVLTLTPYAREEFKVAYEPAANDIERARRLCIRSHMGFGSAATSGQPVGFRIDTARPYGTAQAVWARYPETLATVGQRLAGVLIENRPAERIISDHDRPDTLFFVDPPYLHSTRKLGESACYRHEMTEADHVALLGRLKVVKGMVVLSGYRSDLYADLLSDWISHEKQTAAASGRGSATRTEVVWLNPTCAEALKAVTA